MKIFTLGDLADRHEALSDAEREVQRCMRSFEQARTPQRRAQRLDYLAGAMNFRDELRREELRLS